MAQRTNPLLMIEILKSLVATECPTIGRAVAEGTIEDAIIQSCPITPEDRENYQQEIMVMAEWRTGDKVVIDCADQQVSGIIVLASANGMSLMLNFEAILDGHIGMMPVLRHDDGIYRSIVTQRPVTLTKVKR